MKRIHERVQRAEADVPYLFEDENDSLHPLIKDNIRGSYNQIIKEANIAYDMLCRKLPIPEKSAKTLYLNVIRASQVFWTDLWSNLAALRDDENEKIEAFRMLKERNAFSAESFAALISQQTASTDPIHTTESQTEGQQAHEQPEAPAWLGQLIAGLTDKAETSRRPPNMKLPETFTGTDNSKFRAWWRLVKGYMKVNEATMPNDTVKIAWIGALLRDEALNWFHARETRHELAHEEDDWARFRRAMEKRFTDEQETRKDEEAMRSLRYEGSISNYMSRIEEYNSRVGMGGATFRNMIITAMTPRVIDTIYSRAGDIPDDDNELVAIVKKAGKAVEESDRVKNLIQKRDPKPANNKTKETLPIPEKTRPTEPTGQANNPEKEPQTNAPGPQTGMPYLWKNPAEAFEGVPQDEIDAHKADATARRCLRCGRLGHSLMRCYARRTIAGTELPIHPSKQEKPTETKRKHDENDSEKKDDAKAMKKEPAVVAAATIRKICEEDSESEADPYY